MGARIKVILKGGNTQRSVYRDVNSGGSFGSNPLSQHIGIGHAASIKRLK
ncbi:MAG: ASPIC/UnbV domain-containing protein [Panacibacter sp.]